MKYFVYVFLFVVGFILTGLLFNHVGAWFGVAASVILVFSAIYYITSLIKKQKLKTEIVYSIK